MWKLARRRAATEFQCGDSAEGGQRMRTDRSMNRILEIGLALANATCYNADEGTRLFRR